MPARAVVEKEAIAMAADPILSRIECQISHSADRRRRLYPLVGRSHPKCPNPAAGNAGGPDSRGVDFRPRNQIVHGAHRVPTLDAGWSISGRMPPPPSLIQQPPMQACNFAEFDRVHNQRDISVSCEPYTMALAFGRGFGSFPPIAVVMADLVENRRLAARRRPREIEIGCDIQSRKTLKMKFLDGE